MCFSSPPPDHTKLTNVARKPTRAQRKTPSTPSEPMFNSRDIDRPDTDPERPHMSGPQGHGYVPMSSPACQVE